MTCTDDFYKSIIDHLYDGVYFVDRQRVITYWNRGAQRITGYAGDHVVGRSCRDNLLNHVTADGVQLCLDKCPLALCMADGEVREAEVFLHHADGHRVPVHVRVAPLRDAGGEIVGAVETFSSDMRMVTLREQVRELRRTARTDALTGAANRQRLEGRLRALAAELGPTGDGAGVLFIDIDRFKQFNDRHGHETGDKVLRMVAATLKGAVRETDVVGRWGGEEFLAILYDVRSPEELKAIGEKVRLLVLSSRLDWADQSLTVTISVGATLWRPRDTPETLVRRADEMMYRSKQSGRNRVTVG